MSSHPAPEMSRGARRQWDLAARVLLGALVLAGCGESQGPTLAGDPFLRIVVDGDTLGSLVSQVGCGDFGMTLLVAQLDPPIPDADVLEIHVADLRRADRFTLGDPASGSFARTHFLGPAGLAYRTDSLSPGHLTISDVDFGDSLVAGRFAFPLVSDLPPTITYQVSGAFRLALGQLYTVEHPEGTPCQAPSHHAPVRLESRHQWETAQ